MIKQHKKNEFFVKHLKGIYYVVIDSYDMSTSYLATSKDEALAECSKLNKMMNDYYKL